MKGSELQPDDLADDVRIASKAPFPETARQNHNPWPARPIFLRRKGSPHHRDAPEYAKVGFRNVDTPDLLGGAIAAEVHAWPHKVVDRHRFKKLGLADNGELGDGQGWAIAGSEFPDNINETIRVFVGQRTQQNAINHREDGGVSADAQRQGEDRDQGESGILQKHADRVTAVLSHIS